MSSRNAQVVIAPRKNSVVSNGAGRHAGVDAPARAAAAGGLSMATVLAWQAASSSAAITNGKRDSGNFIERDRAVAEFVA